MTVFDLRETRDMGPGDFCVWLEDVIVDHLCPQDFDHAGMYIIDESLPSVNAAGRVRGFTSDQSCYAYQDRLKAEGRWFGPAPCLVVDMSDAYRELHAMAQAAGKSQEDCDDFGTKNILASVLHETAHVLRGRGWPTEQKAAADDIRAAFSDMTSHGPEQSLDAPAPPPFRGHEGAFLRCAIHLHYRAKMHGLDVPLAAMLPMKMYNLSPAEDYRKALDTEPVRFLIASAAFRDPRYFGSRPPQRFVDLWHNDIKTWWTSIAGEPSPEQERAAIEGLRLYPVS